MSENVSRNREHLNMRTVLAAQNRTRQGMGGNVPLLELVLQNPSNTTPKRAESYPVAPDEIVEVVADPNNTGLVHVALSQQAAKLIGSRATISTASSPRQYTGLRNLSQIWMLPATAGEGIIIRVLGRRG